MVRLRLTARMLVIAGAIAISLGAGLVYRPAGLIVGGGALVLIGLFLVEVGGSEREPGTARSLRPRR